MATERTDKDPRVAAQASVLKEWGQEWRRTNGKSQQELGRTAGYGSDESPKSAAVAISRIESGKTVPSGSYRQRLLDTLGHTEEELEHAADKALNAPKQPNALMRAFAGPIYAENEVRRSQIVAASNRLTGLVTAQLESSEQTFELARSEFILPFLECAAKIDWQPLLDSADGAATANSTGGYDAEIRGLREQTRIGVLQTVSQTAAGAIAGAGVGAGTAAGVFAVVSATATASTGTAIASLSGAAASSATLAWLGGGSLAAGGMGIAGGTAVLTGVVALPALLALGGVLVWKGRKFRKEAEKLDAAQQALREMQDAFAQAAEWDDAQQAVVQRAALIGKRIHGRYISAPQASWVSDSDSEARIPWTDLPADLREALEHELRLLTIILDTRALPIWLGVKGVGQPDLTDMQAETATASAEWIHDSLALAEFDLDEPDEWIRERMAHDLT
jgi:transcriptional regulator with XRE-family HTH domain